MSVHVPLPEGLPLPLLALEQRAQMTDIIRSLFPPAHTGQLHPRGNYGLARAFHRAAADLPALRDVMRVIHSTHVVRDVAAHFVVPLPRLAPLRRPQLVQFLQNSFTAAVFHRLAPLL